MKTVIPTPITLTARCCQLKSEKRSNADFIKVFNVLAFYVYCNQKKIFKIIELLFEYINTMAEVIDSYNKGNPNIDRFAGSIYKGFTHFNTKEIFPCKIGKISLQRNGIT